MIRNLITRGVSSLLGIVALLLVTKLYPADIVAKYILFNYIISMSSGWASGSFRSKLVSDYIKNQEIGNWKNYSLWILVFGGSVYALVCIFLYYEVQYTDINFSEYITLFLVVTCQAIVAVYYSYYWSNGKLYLSYSFDSFHMLSVVIATLIGLVFLFNYKVILIIFSILCLLLLYKIRLSPPKVTKQLFLASLNSQIIAIISFSDVFFIAATEPVSIIKYRWIMVSFTILTMIIQVLRQMSIIKKEGDLSFIVYLSIFFSSILVLTLKYNFIFDPKTLILFIGIGIMLQAFTSFHAIKLYRIRKAGLITSTNIMILLGVFCLVKTYTINDSSDLLAVKAIIIYLSIFFASGLAFVTKILKISQ